MSRTGISVQRAPSRSEVTRRAYELRSRWRSTPHGAFAGVATARTAGAGVAARRRGGAGHRARTSPSGSWLAELSDVLLADPAVVGLLRLMASNLVIRRGQGSGQQQDGVPSGGGCGGWQVTVVCKREGDACRASQEAGVVRC
jgi:hypothetical protein